MENAPFNKGRNPFLPRDFGEQGMAKMLLVDDSWLTRKGLSVMISGAPHGVIEAETVKRE